MRFSTLIKTTLPALLFTAALGCGSSGNGTMNVHLVDGPTDQFDKVTIFVKKLEIHGPNGEWQTLATFADPGRKIDNLLDLHDGIEELLVNGASLPKGHYDQMRMLLGPGNTVIPTGGQETDLKVPSGLQSGIKFPVSFDVAPDTTRDVFIDFDAHRSIFVHKAGMSGQYILRPVIRCVDKLVTGAIKGTLIDASTMQGIAGVPVMAETLDGSGNPHVLRSVTTNASGEYTLDLLPKGGTYYVVAQPVVTGAVYMPNYGTPTSTITDAMPIVTAAPIPFTATSSFGSLQVNVPAFTATEQSDEVSVLKAFAPGKTFVIRTLDPALTTENPAVGLPADTYTVYGERTTPGDPPTVATSSAASVTIPTDTYVDLTY